MVRRQSFGSVSSFPVEGKPTKPLERITSNETTSVLSRTVTATSINSQASVNTSFETNWLPNSFVISKKKYHVSLKLGKEEISMLRKSWTIVTSTESRADDTDDNSLRRLNSRTSSVGTSNTSNQSMSIISTTNSSTMAKPRQFNTADFSSYLFCIQFYNNLLSMIPDIERIIPNIKHQAAAFAGVIQVAIDTLEDLSKMKESLLNLGHLHARILGIDAPWFKTMGHALIKTFQDWFGNSPESFPLELEEAWIKLYCFLANSILQGGIDPAIEYNVIGSGAKGNSEFTESINEEYDEEKLVVSGETEKNEHITRLTESFSSTSLVGEVLKKNAINRTVSKQSSFTSFSQPIPSNQPSPPVPQQKKSYMSDVASKNINKLTKRRGDKEDCTIM